MSNELYKHIFVEKPCIIDYDDFKLEVNVRKREAEHNVKCSFRGKSDFKKAYSSIFRFFNELVWFHDMEVSDINGGHSQNSHVFLNYTVNNDSYLLDFKQQVFEKRQHLALSFFREARCNESPYYRFFCFAKILEIPFTKDEGESKVQWVEDQLNNLTGKLAVSFRDRKINNLCGRNLAKWLHENGRNAIAHARLEEITRDPNNYDDWDEIKWANEIMEELAEQLIIKKLGVSR